MRAEDLSLIAQLVESMNLATQELEKALEEKNAARFKKAKLEILKFQKQIDKILG